MSPEELAVRKLEFLDIATERVPDYKYKESEDPCKFKSARTGRGPLTPGWRVSSKRVESMAFLKSKICLRSGMDETDYVCI